MLIDCLMTTPDGDGGVVDCACFGMLSGLEIASTATSLALALWWLIVRNTASYAWVLQVREAIILHDTVLAAGETLENSFLHVLCFVRA